MRAIFRYPGSKWGLAPWIISFFPEGYEKMVYLEPFLGSGAVFFNKNPGAVETINDIDGDVVNLFRILRERPDELRRQLELTPYSREEYDASYEPCEDDMERARRFMVRTTQAIGPRLNCRCGWRNHKQMKIGGTACKWAGITATIDAATTRLRGNTSNLVQIERMDAIKLIERYNDQNVLMYLDPPYVLDARKSGKLYQCEMDSVGHENLLEAICKNKAKIILSGYESELYNEKLSGWHKFTTISQTTSTKKATECIWLNYDPPYRQMEIEVREEQCY